MNDFERLLSEAFDEVATTEVIRPAAVLPEVAARLVLVELALRDVRAGGLWRSEPARWRRYDTPIDESDPTPHEQHLLGTVEVAYGTPTRYEITIFRASVTSRGVDQGWTVERLCDEALSFGGYVLGTCPRAELSPPPKPFHG
jgi:hypothetical protein